MIFIKFCYYNIRSLQVNFYGIKSDISSTQIKIKQSQADRSKKEFVPVKIDLIQKTGNNCCFLSEIEFYRNKFLSALVNVTLFDFL